MDDNEYDRVDEYDTGDLCTLYKTSEAQAIRICDVI